MPKFLIEAVAILGAISVGLGLFFTIYFAPVLFGQNQFMPAWGWVGWIPGIFVAHRAGGYVREIIRNQLFAEAPPVEPDQRRRAAVFLTGVGLLVFAGYLGYTSSFSDRWELVASVASIGAFLLVAALRATDSFIRQKVVRWVLIAVSVFYLLGLIAVWLVPLAARV